MNLLPHSGTALLLAEVVRHESGFIEATGRVPAAHPLVAGRAATCFLALELGAQAAAALEALSREDGDRAPRIGHLARVREATFFRPDLPVDTPLRVTAQLEGAAPPLAIYRICVSLEGVDVLRAVLSTHSQSFRKQNHW